MSKHIRRSSDLDPNMLIILLLILTTFSKRPIFFVQEELHKNRRGAAANNDVPFNSEDSGNLFNDSVNTKSSVDLNNSEGNTDYSIVYKDLEELDRLSSVTATNDIIDKGNLISSEVIPEYPNKLIKPNCENNQLVIAVPVLISQFEIEFSTEAEIELDFPALDIKRINKRVILQECKLLTDVSKLFLSGKIRENIEYSAIKSEAEDNNDIRHVAVEIPFKCTTVVTYFTLPIINYDNTQIEIETLREDSTGNEINEKTQISREEFNDKIYCKLIRNEINELYIADDNNNSNLEDKRQFNMLNEKLVVKLTLKLIQEQQINIKNDTF
ncbi:CsxC family protein [Candidatus Clostridium stratigraminis]|uniref:CsxC family protein n=1 Tax=Candidatus Clostridium stratigraminis TaxID=3381661 RepID=A0ABW8T884_9CLOT